MEMCLEMLWRSGDELDYADFTKDERIQSIMRRRQFNKLKQTTTDAFVEIVNIIADVQEKPDLIEIMKKVKHFEI